QKKSKPQAGLQHGDSRVSINFNNRRVLDSKLTPVLNDEASSNHKADRIANKDVPSSDDERDSVSVEDLEKKLGDVEEVNKTVPQTRLFSNLFDTNRQDNFELNLLNVVKNNCEEEKRKEKNILIFSTKFNNKKEEDDRLVNDTFREIDTSPILVELNTKSDKKEVLKNAKKLRASTQFNNVYVGPDQTLAERAVVLGMASVIEKWLKFGPVMVQSETRNNSNNIVKPNNKSNKNTTQNNSNNQSNQNNNNKRSNNNSFLKFWYTNATSLENKLHDFTLSIKASESDIVMVSETMFKENSMVHVDGFSIYSI
ncbi:unnamed protein product, partial [Brachionus calyciflorus]